MEELFGNSAGGTIKNCVNYAEVKYGADAAGGILGYGGEETSVEFCINYGRISGMQQLGGITGCSNLNSSIKFCYNRGEIVSVSNYGTGGICGIFGHPTKGEKGEIYGCYNTGKVIGCKNDVAGISGFMNGVTRVENVINCGEVYVGSTKITNDIGSEGNFFGRIIGEKGSKGSLNNYRNMSDSELKNYSQNEIEKFLGENYIPDGKKIDKDGKLVDNKDNNGNIIYLNDGYPILKWQGESGKK